ncbi:MAG: hypothetical protein WD509_01465 [Candidatus Paceibacterota bacterium]
MNEENKNVNEEPVMETPQEDTPNTPQGNSTEEHASSGPLVGVAIIILVLIVGGIYFWNTEVNNHKGDATQETSAEATVDALNTQGTSDEVAAIEADLDTTDLDNLDAELDDLLNGL